MAGPPKIDAALAEQLIVFRRHLHRQPELSFEEAQTAARVAEQLNAWGIHCRTGVGGHGVVADLTCGLPGPLLALRADMDALPITEESGLPFASERPGLMHACGHDAHTAILLGAARLLVASKFAGTIRLIFQAAEEMNAGARAMIEEGVLEGVSEIYGLHNLPTLSVGLAATRSGPLMGSVDRFELELEGRGGHGAMPEQAQDPIVCAAAIIMGLQTIAARETSPFEPVVVTVGSIQGGNANNVIPQRVHLTGTVRTFASHVWEAIPERVERLVHQIAAAYRCEPTLSYIRQTPVLVNTDACVSEVEATIDAVIGTQRRTVAPPTLAGEDFSIYLQHVPGCFFWLGSGPEAHAEQAYGLHHPRYTLHEGCIPLGAELLAAVALRRLGMS